MNTDPDLPTASQVLIVGNHGRSWGFDEDRRVAEAQFRRRGGDVGDGYIIAHFPPTTTDVTVYDNGDVTWKGPNPRTHTVGARRNTR